MSARRPAARRSTTAADVGRHALGARAEEAVADYLRVRGYAVLARNRRLGPLEIDLIAQKGELAVIVEVRTRGPGSLIGPLASIDAKKRASLVRAAERLWRETLAKAEGVARLRIDVATVAFANGQTRVDYFEGALTA